MLIRLRLDPAALREWHRGLLAALAAHPGTVVEVEPRPGLDPRDVERIFALERRLRRNYRSTLANRIAPDLSASAMSDRPADLTLDLVGAGPAPAGRLWTLTVDGVPGEVALPRAIVAGRSPVATLVEAGTTVAAIRPGTESHGNVLAMFEDALARLQTLILAALNGALPARPAEEPSPGNVGEGASFAPMLSAANVVRRAARQRLARLAYRTPHWRVGWRRLDGPDLIDLRRHPDAGWTDLPDDGLRFYADPFPIVHEGRTYLFVEEYPHATGRGIISAVVMGADGPEGRPEPVLDLPYHLSYPNVFAHDGALWMIPESSAAGTVDLYRATDFPRGWVKARTLLSGVTAGDATLLQQDGRWCMFATVRGDAGSSSDMLCLWSAPDLFGPWVPHRRNPILIDSLSARPAGRMVARGGALWRPVQDCRTTYGAALGLARITRLDDDGFAQSLDTLITAGPRWPGHQIHTLNAAGGFEFIDGTGWSPKWWQQRRR